MSYAFDPILLLMIPFGLVLAFCVWALWNFSEELRAGKRHRIRRTSSEPEIRIYWRPERAIRFRHGDGKEAV
jgi:hypothetical protein